MKVTWRQSEIIFVSYFHRCVSLFDFSGRYQLKAEGFATELSWWVRDDWGPESHSGMGFSTPLQDNDASSENCAAETLSAFWYFFYLFAKLFYKSLFDKLGTNNVLRAFRPLGKTCTARVPRPTGGSFGNPSMDQQTPWQGSQYTFGPGMCKERLVNIKVAV